ncbi:tetratricopeptide repeat protein [Mangrovibacterium sp.]|uniref:tetratricopeptide repeat protein n=1 Tax=Mangrovibacterium sp. TaxID=1961364 RepID=UPI003563EB6B
MKRILLIASCLVFLTRIVGAQNGEALKIDALTAESKEHFAEAAKLFEEAYQAFRAQTLADTLCVFHAGLNYVRIGQFAKAIPFLDECIGLNINPGSSTRLLADSYVGLKQPGKAEELLLEGKATMPEDSTEFDEKLAYLYFNNGRYDKATDCFQQVTQAHPENKNYLYLLGLSLHRIQKYDQAIAVFELMQTEFPEDRRATKLLGVTLFERADELYRAQVDSLVRHDQTSVGVHPEFEELNEHYAQARAMLEKSLAEYPYDQLLISSLYKLYQRQGDAQRAEHMEKRIK